MDVVEFGTGLKRRVVLYYRRRWGMEGRTEAKTVQYRAHSESNSPFWLESKSTV